jgi:hypothetical protein
MFCKRLFLNIKHLFLSTITFTLKEGFWVIGECRLPAIGYCQMVTSKFEVFVRFAKKIP